MAEALHAGGYTKPLFLAFEDNVDRVAALTGVEAKKAKQILAAAEKWFGQKQFSEDELEEHGEEKAEFLEEIEELHQAMLEQEATPEDESAERSAEEGLMDLGDTSLYATSGAARAVGPVKQFAGIDLYNQLAWFVGTEEAEGSVERKKSKREVGKEEEEGEMRTQRPPQRRPVHHPAAAVISSIRSSSSSASHTPSARSRSSISSSNVSLNPLA